MTLAGVKRDLTKRRFWSRLSTQTLSCIGLFSILAGIASSLFPKALPPHGTLLAILAVLASAAYGMFKSWPRPVWQTYNSPNTEVCIVEGDLFEQDGNIVIGMSDTFDTEIPHVIDEKGVQAQLLTRIYRSDIQALNKALAEALKSHSVDHSFAPSDQKRGKQHAYPLGTVAVIEPAPRKLYFCVAYSEMNSRNEAHGSIDGVWRSLNNLWAEVRARGNGDPISIAVIGGGQARISQHFPAQDSIRFMILSYMFASRQEKVASKLSIVVRKSDAASIDMLELRAFLKSLRPS